MDQDDRPVGRLLSRREALALMGGAGALLLGGSLGRALEAAESLPAGCIVRPQQTEGPYFIDEELERSDLRSDPGDGSVRPGALLDVSFKVSRLDGLKCTPLPSAVVDLWHCDAAGLYSDVDDPFADTRGKKFLRGHQRTDSKGVARFTTIYPGWYPGRTVHIHFKIRSAPAARSGFEFTSQLYFDDTFTDKVHGKAPYAEKGKRTLRNAGDGIYRRGGSQLMLKVAAQGRGYAASPFEIALQT